MNIVCRTQTTLGYTHLEYYVRYDPITRCMKLSNFECKKKSVVKSYSSLKSKNTFTRVLFCETIVLNSKLEAWLVKDDFCSKSGFLPEHIENKSTFFEILIDFQDCETVLSNHNEIKDLLHLTCEPEPLALYHGSGKDKQVSILKHGLFETFGMLGNGVYLGTFYKACRYASRTQTYDIRLDGTIYRCIAFCLPQNTTVYPNDTWTCMCEVCQKANNGFEQVCDHLTSWNTGHLSAAHVKVSTKPFAINTKKRAYVDKTTQEVTYKNTERYLCKNEEWAFRSDAVFVRDCAVIDLSSVYKPFYNPLQRNMSTLSINDDLQ